MSTYERGKLNVNGDVVNLRDAGAVRFDRAQSLTAAQQAQARDNIGAGTGTGGVTGVKGGAENDYRTGQVNLTPANIGLGNVDNTSDADKPVSTAQQAALNGKVDKVTGKGLSTNDYTDADKAALAGKLDASQKGAASGVAELDSEGKVPSAQLPYQDATTSASGLMSATDKTKLDGLNEVTWLTAQLNTAYHNPASTDNRIKAILCNRILVVDVVMNTNTSVPLNSVIATVTLPSPLVTQAHYACITHQSELVRLYMNGAGEVKVETAVNANQWISCTLVTIV